MVNERQTASLVQVIITALVSSTGRWTIDSITVNRQSTQPLDTGNTVRFSSNESVTFCWVTHGALKLCNNNNNITQVYRSATTKYNDWNIWKASPLQDQVGIHWANKRWWWRWWRTSILLTLLSHFAPLVYCASEWKPLMTAGFVSSFSPGHVSTTCITADILFILLTIMITLLLCSWTYSRRCCRGSSSSILLLYR